MISGMVPSKLFEEGDPAFEIVQAAARQLAEGDVEAALALIAEANALAPETLPVHFMTGLASWALGDIANAVVLIRDCHERDPMNGPIAEVLASLYAQVGNIGESLFFGKMGTALGNEGPFAALVPPSFPPFDVTFFAIKERPLFLRAKLQAATGKHIEAIKLAGQHLELFPDDQECRHFLGAALLRIGAGDAAGEVLDTGNAPAEVISLRARAFTLLGERAAAKEGHASACGAASDNREIAAAALADARWLEPDPSIIARRSQGWVERFCGARRPGSWGNGEGKLTIGYIVSDFSDPQDAAAVAAVARAHDKTSVTVHAYGRGQQSWDVNGMLSGAFQKWRDISAIDPMTLARVFQSDEVDVIVDLAGFEAPTTLLALARLGSALRLSWLGLPLGLGGRIYDGVLTEVGESLELSGLPALSIGAGGYPLVRNWTRRLERYRASVPQFGADVGLAHLDPETVGLWTRVLAACPEAKLVLRANDFSSKANVGRLIARFGRELAGRIDVSAAEGLEDFYASIDIALTPIHAASPRRAAEALACGVVPVALDGRDLRQLHGAFLTQVGLPELVASSPDAYVELAAGLVRNVGPVAEKVSALAAHGESSAAAIAAGIERAARHRLANPS